METRYVVVVVYDDDDDDDDIVLFKMHKFQKKKSR